MESKIVLGGRFRVFEDGSINRIKDGVEKPAAVHYTGRDGKYGAVSYMLNGKEKRAYVHRLVAAAFVPNPEKKRQVNHIDGDTRNNAASNLEWVTAKENIRHAYDTGLADPLATAEPCVECGDFTNAKDGLCVKCKAKQKSREKETARRSAQAACYGNIDLSLLSERERLYVMRAADGLSVSEIARIYGVSRQAVDAALLTAQKKQTGELVSASYRAKTNELARLTARRDKLLRKLEDATLAADLAKIKYEAAEQQLAALESAIHKKAPLSAATLDEAKR